MAELLMTPLGTVFLQPTFWETVKLSCPEKSPDLSPSNSRRKKGDGSGYIQLHPTKQKGKIYDQYYYHYEIWEGGSCLVKSCVYIPKRLLAEIEAMDRAKEPVTKILRALGKSV